MIEKFKDVLEPLLEARGVSRTIVGDIDDLLMTSEKLVSLLRDIEHGKGALDAEELERRLFRLQIMVEQDLPMIFRDLLPCLRMISGEKLAKG